MKKMVMALAASAAALVSMSGAANAAPWQSVNQREAALSVRIDQGLRSGALTRAEAQSLRSRLRVLERLEISYRRNGLTIAERRILDRRFDALSRQVQVQKHDRQFRR